MLDSLLLASVALFVGMYGVMLWGLGDAVRRPARAWEASGQSLALWVGLQLVGLVVCALGWFVSLVYLVEVRPRLDGRRPPPHPPEPTAPA